MPDQMSRELLGDLSAFMVVAEEGNFTRAGVRLGISQSAVSHTIRRLEDAIGVKLLNRSWRRVTTTDAGEQLLATLRPSFGSLVARIEELRALGESPGGLIRVTASRSAARMILWPIVSQLAREYPGIKVEISTDGRLSDLAEDRFDCAIRLGEHLNPDMIAVPVGPMVEMAAVATPAYFEERGVPLHPDDLERHACIGMRHRTTAPVYDWEFEKEGLQIVKKFDGPFILNDPELVIEAARNGHGIIFLTLDEVADDLERGTLQRVLTDWCPPFEGYFLCYSGRRNVSSALRLLIDRLRYRAEAIR